MVFLCGRPGCGRESSATLQIDAPSSTISLVDPRVSRDGVPLCPHHADATTPPLGWSMNDLRSRHRTLAPVPSIGPKTGEIVSTPPKKRPKKGGNPLFQSSRPEPDVEAEPEIDEPVDFATRATPDLQANSSAAGDTGADGAEGGDDALTFRVSREVRTMSVSIATADREGAEDRLDDESDEDDGKRAPASRPTRRREVMDADDPEDDKFPWHYQFHDDEPEELQAKSPLLSRAFRSSVG